jgi:formylglycine-generating enzyme required for sulfatase activity
MAGNVWEWTATPYHGDRVKPSAQAFVTKGGDSGGANKTAAAKPDEQWGIEASARLVTIGFRCARDAQPSKN